MSLFPLNLVYSFNSILSFLKKKGKSSNSGKYKPSIFIRWFQYYHTHTKHTLIWKKKKKHFIYSLDQYQNWIYDSNCTYTFSHNLTPWQRTKKVNNFNNCCFMFFVFEIVYEFLTKRFAQFMNCRDIYSVEKKIKRCPLWFNKHNLSS